MFIHDSFLYSGPELEINHISITGEQINTLGYSNTTEYYSAVNMNELVIHGAARMNFTIIMLKEARHKRVFAV